MAELRGQVGVATAKWAGRRGIRHASSKLSKTRAIRGALPEQRIDTD